MDEIEIKTKRSADELYLAILEIARIASQELDKLDEWLEPSESDAQTKRQRIRKVKRGAYVRS